MTGKGATQTTSDNASAWVVGVPPDFSSSPHVRRPSESQGARPSPMRPPSATNNEFADAAARMFANRAPLDGVSDLPPSPDPADAWEGSSSSFLSALRPGSHLSRTLLLVLFVAIGFLVVWYLRPEPPQPVPAAPLPVKRVAEVKPEFRAPVDMPKSPPPPIRQEAVEVKPVAPSEPAVAASPLPSPKVPAAPLTKDEIKELQGKLGAIGFGPGPADGVVGPQTQAALRRYAQSRGLANPDATRELLSRLEAEVPARR